MKEIKLFKVTVQHKIVVCADNGTEAESIARHVIQCEDVDADSSVAKLIESIKDVPPSWIASIPWGNGNPNDLTCAQIAHNL